VPADGTPRVRVSGLHLTARGYSLVVTVGGRSERIVVDGATASITPLG
jgi:hypothetical protein